MSVLDHITKAALASAARSAVERGPQEAASSDPVTVAGDRVTISFGNVPPFTISKDAAMKFAMLILKKCGVQFNFE